MGSVPAEPPSHLIYRHEARVGSSLRDLWASRDIIYTLAERDIRAQYKQATLGFLWALIFPLAMLGIFTIIFSRTTSSNGIPGIPYPILAYIGILCWTFFSGSLGAGGTSLLTNNALMSKTQFPRECFPLETVLVTAVNSVLAWIPLVLLFALYRFVPHPTTVWVPLFVLIELAFTVGLTVMVSALIIQMRDLAQVLPIIIMLGLFATPVIWQFNRIPTNLQIVYGFFSPLGPVIDDTRRAMLLGLNPVPGPLLGGHRRQHLLSGAGVPALQAIGGELCRHCLTGRSSVEHVWKKFRADRTAPLFYDQFVRDASIDHQGDAQGLSLGAKRRQPQGGTRGHGRPHRHQRFREDHAPQDHQQGHVSVGRHRARSEGRLGALLSVTSGIHPDLTGRENVFLYGAVLGMRRKITHERFDEIVEFAGLDDAIDRQVKFFSLGMQMRLGFSIAAFLEPDILLVDEVLSVGDANFQAKCIQRIEEVVRQGTTLVYVSHDLTSVEAVCKEALWLADAVVQGRGPHQRSGGSLQGVHPGGCVGRHLQRRHRPGSEIIDHGSRRWSGPLPGGC